MDYFHLFLAYTLQLGPLLGGVLLASIAAVVFIGIGISRPEWLVFPYLAVLVCFSQSLYGNLEDVRNIYSRGTGQLFFSFLVWLLMGMAAMTVIRRAFSAAPRASTNLVGPYLAMLALFVGNLIVAPLMGVNIAAALSGNGIINLILLGFLFFVLMNSLSNQAQIQRLLQGLMLLIAARGVFGLARLAFFGGDPSNVYDNIEHIGVKISYFDICDSMLACFGVTYALRRLFSEGTNLPPRNRLVLVTFVLLELAVVVLSYRRTAWAGLVLVGCFLVLLLPPRQRWVPLLVSPLLLVLIGFVAGKRLSASAGGRGLFESFFYDLMAKSPSAAEGARTLELKFATATALDNPVFGAGIWGRYEGYGAIPWQVGPEAFAFVHSGPIHLLLKTGLVGVAIVSVAVFLFIRFVARSRRQLREKDRCLFDAALAGLIFMVPDFVVGAPIPQFRTTQLFALLMAIPYVIVAVHATRPPKPIHDEHRPQFVR